MKKKMLATVLFIIGVIILSLKMPKKAEEVRELNDRMSLYYATRSSCNTLHEDEEVTPNGKTCKEVKEDYEKVPGKLVETLNWVYPTRGETEK